jgi:hypothetical protein
MKVLETTPEHLHATHKGANIHIDREDDGRFYIIVTWKDGSTMYDGWAPEGVGSMEDALKEALRGSMLGGE